MHVRLDAEYQRIIKLALRHFQQHVRSELSFYRDSYVDHQHHEDYQDMQKVAFACEATLGLLSADGMGLYISRGRPEVIEAVTGSIEGDDLFR